MFKQMLLILLLSGPVCSQSLPVGNPVYPSNGPILKMLTATPTATVTPTATTNLTATPTPANTATATPTPGIMLNQSYFKNGVSVASTPLPLVTGYAGYYSYATSGEITTVSGTATTAWMVDSQGATIWGPHTFPIGSLILSFPVIDQGASTSLLSTQACNIHLYYKYTNLIP